MRFFLLLLFVPAIVNGFDSSFNYGCQNGKCTFQLVVPDKVAQYIDENTLSQEVSNIASALGSLNVTIQTFNGNGTAQFTELFNANWTVVNNQSTSLNTSVNAAAQNAVDLNTASANSNYTANLLFDAMSCFKNASLSSYTCFTAPTTVAPPTTLAASTTANPSTGNSGSTASGGSTVPYTGPTGGSSPVTDSSSPSTSSGASGSPSTVPTDAASTVSKQAP